MRSLTLTALAACTAVAAAAPARALTPEQIVILVDRSDLLAGRLARHYADVRGVPRLNIVPLEPLGAADAIPQAVYRAKIVEPVRAQLRRRKLVAGARCLLLVGRLPLAVEPDPPTSAEEQEIKWLRDQLKSGTLEFYQQAWRVDQLAHGRTGGAPPKKLPKDVRGLYGVQRLYAAARDSADRTVRQIPADQRKALAHELEAIRRDVEGLKAVQLVKPIDTHDPDYKRKLAEWERWHADVDQTAKSIAELAAQRGPASVRDRRRRLAEHLGGRAELLRQMASDLGELSSASRQSALDSELALLWQDNYPLAGALANPLLRGLAPATTQPAGESEKPPPALMVARIDGPNLAAWFRVLDECIKLEQAGAGLAGNFCIDGLGASEEDKGPWREDQCVLKMADWPGRGLRMPLVKDSSVMSIPAARANPVAFYFGLGQEERFGAGLRCAPGAVTLSFNRAAAGELHKADSKRWCTGWLNAGAAVTVGAVLPAGAYNLPAPEKFAAGLLTDGLPLAEAYWLAVPQTSWRVVLVGDPLYRPAAKKPPAN